MDPRVASPSLCQRTVPTACARVRCHTVHVGDRPPCCRDTVEGPDNGAITRPQPGNGVLRCGTADVDHTIVIEGPLFAKAGHQRTVWRFRLHYPDLAAGVRVKSN